MKSAAILLIEDDEDLLALLQEELEAEGHCVCTAATVRQAVGCLQQESYDLVISDLRLPDASGLTLLPLLRQQTSPPVMLVITAFGTVSQAVEALKKGADDFLTKPLDMDHFLLAVTRLLEGRKLQGELQRYRSLLVEQDFHGMIAGSASMRDLFGQLRRIAESDGPVLVLGESGTGKEHVARAIHEESPRRDRPYLTVNCGGIPGDLMESEFYGHLPGAFTGANQKRAGLFQQADGGTLLLDEIGEMPMALQTKLLRSLQDGCIRPVGSDREIRVDVRIIAATNRDLDQAVREGRFREDLYFRLETFALRIPPLRERREDILQLANFFLARFAARRHHAIRGFSDEAAACLQRYHYPGNVRELENAVERAVTFCDGALILPRHLPKRLTASTTQPVTGTLPKTLLPVTLDNSAAWPTVDELQRRYARQVLQYTAGNKRESARILGITRRTLYRWLEND